MLSMTPRQKEAYDFIRSFIDQKGYGPSYEEIQEALGLHSKSGVHRIIEGLEERDLIVRRPGIRRSIALKPAFNADYHLRRVLSALDGTQVSDHEHVLEAARFLQEAA
ncbi:LexA family protein [Brucella anthropi]|uniref:Transcriptional repressor, LexA family n=1 Tax=Brucella anthropi (strain ATCC 49188 / DSM 6882 / CCUG 24695 / JCM 21032 / LMG 3331 / NBRC 15819 / NCTC 12168 / Alc 37) TaxID=439375 RepID=A6WVF3_BRUA4|nr:LexA family transcriptional regulator [Brucella anthropi]ABS12957.1 transcriptional repressor, LexA family [Brucella anthropi ATCC 49188]SUA60225.1 LexA repressor [Brucella anthropi]